MQYLKSDDQINGAECSNDAARPTELLQGRLGELRDELDVLTAAGGAPEGRIKPLLDSGYILLDLERRQEAWEMAREAFELAVASDDWLRSVEACDVMFQSEQDKSVKALAHGIWLGVTFPIDPELTVAMLQHLVEDTPPNADGAAVAAAVARYVVDLRAAGKQREDLQFFTSQLLGQVARRHSNGAVDSQELFEFWVDRLELNDPAKLLPRLATILEVMVPDGWWIDRETLRERLPTE